MRRVDVDQDSVAAHSQHLIHTLSAPCHRVAAGCTDQAAQTGEPGRVVHVCRISRLAFLILKFRLQTSACQDKGTLDAILCGDSPEVDAASLLSECLR